MQNNPSLIVSIADVLLRENRDFWSISNDKFKKTEWANSYGLYCLSNPELLQGYRSVKFGLTRASFKTRFRNFIGCWGFTQPLLILAMASIPQKNRIGAQERQVLNKFSAKDYQARIPFPISERESEWLILTDDSIADLRAAFASYTSRPSWRVWSGGLDSKRLDRIIERIPQPLFEFLSAPKKVRNGFRVHWSDGTESSFTTLQIEKTTNIPQSFLSASTKGALTKRFGSKVDEKQDYIDGISLNIAFEDADLPTDNYDEFLRLVEDNIKSSLKKSP